MAIDYGKDIDQQYRDIKSRNAARDARHVDVIAARKGDLQHLMPGVFPPKYSKQMTANIVNVAARDLGEILGELPDIECRPEKPTSLASKRSATRRTRISVSYLESSRMQHQMYSGCDRFVTFGALPVVVEPDVDAMRPILRVDNPVGAYYELDFLGRVKCYFKCWFEPIGSLVAKFPELRELIQRERRDQFGGQVTDSGSDMLEVVKYYGPDKTCLFLPDRSALKLAEAPTPVPGKVPVFIAELPKWDEETRGQFDEMLWIQAARARLATIQLQAAEFALNAPLDVPSTVTEVPYGPNAIVRNDSNKPIQKVQLNLPAAAFTESAMLQQEERIAARYPEGRSGNIDASIITGQGVKELLGTMDSQVKTSQDLLGRTISDALCYAMELDETLWGDVERFIEGKADGAPFVERYKPSRDIAGNYKVEAVYGLSYGMDAQRGLIFALQLNGARIVDKGSVRRQFAKAFGVDAEEVSRLLDIEEVDDAVKQAVFNMGSLISPQGMMQGVDPVKTLRQMAMFQKQREKGASVVDALLKAFEPTKEEKKAQEEQQAALASNPMAAAQQELQALDAPGPAGSVPVSPQGQATGGLQQLIAGLSSSGEPQLGARISQMLPT